MTDPFQIVLAIESAISGGSVSLLRNGIEIANWIGTSNVSKAEDLLVNIDELLTKNKVQSKELNLIAVSAGPGSFTGIRIGIATALGLKAGLGIPMSSESALKAMAFAQSTDARIITAIPMGRSAVCLQTFQKTNEHMIAVDEPSTMAEDSFLSLVDAETSSDFVIHATLFEKTNPRSNVQNFGANIAHAIGSICVKDPGVVTEPLFVSKSF